jgi:hypothetical protein
LKQKEIGLFEREKLVSERETEVMIRESILQEKEQNLVSSGEKSFVAQTPSNVSDIFDSECSLITSPNDADSYFDRKLSLKSNESYSPSPIHRVQKENINPNLPRLKTLEDYVPKSVLNFGKGNEHNL